MLNMTDLMGHFGDWETFVHDTEIDKYVIRAWNETQDDAHYYFIVGSVPIPNGILLTLANAEEEDVTAEESVKKYGVSFATLDSLLKNGFEIWPKDQNSDEEDTLS